MQGAALERELVLAQVRPVLDSALDLPPTATGQSLAAAARLAAEASLAGATVDSGALTDLARRQVAAAGALALFDTWAVTGRDSLLEEARRAAAGGDPTQPETILATLTLGWILDQPQLLAQAAEQDRALAERLASTPPDPEEVPLMVLTALAAYQWGGQPRALARAEALGRSLPARSADASLSPETRAHARLALAELAPQREGATGIDLAAALADLDLAGTAGSAAVACARAAIRPLLTPVRVSLVGNPLDPRFQDLIAPLRRLRWPGLALVPLHPLIGTHYSNVDINPDPTAMVECGDQIMPPARSSGALVRALADALDAPGWRAQLDRRHL